MKVAPPCEIKVALVGYVSVGKTTVLNALFRDKYSDVAMRRTTAGVNQFRISTPKTNGDGADEASCSWSMKADNTRTAESTLKETAVDNAILRNTSTVQEKTFDIELQDELCEMRKDTKLVLVDIPGINEAGASSKYKDYVSDKWHTFDCVVVVMDGRHGVNTEEQINLLEFVAEKCRNAKDVPVIIICNKVDEPDEEEQQVLVGEARGAVERIFQVNDRIEALDKLLHETSTNENNQGSTSTADDKKNSLFPVFIPLSAIHGFIYQTASLMSLDMFQNFDKGSRGETWTRKLWQEVEARLSKDEKVAAAHQVVVDPEQCREGLELSNFDKFLKVLSYSVGGEVMQRSLIIKQMDVAASRLLPNSDLVIDLQAILDICHVLERPTGFLSGSFWRVYEKYETMAFEQFTRPDQVDTLANPMKQLIAYHDVAKNAGWQGEVTVIVKRMQSLIQHQIGVIFEKKEQWNQDGFTPAHDLDIKDPISWATLPCKGWVHVFSSLLVLAHECVFLEHFSREKVWLEECLRLAEKQTDGIASGTMCRYCWGSTVFEKRCVICQNLMSKSKSKCKGHGNCKGMGGRSYCNGQGVEYCLCSKCGRNVEPCLNNASLQIKYANGQLEPVDEEVYKSNVGIEIPVNGPCDPSHYGHLLWTFCKFMNSLKK